MVTSLNTTIRISVLLFFILNAYSALGQGLLGGGGESDRISGKFKFIPLPYLDYDVATGYTLGFIPMARFNPSAKDTVSPSSTAGLLGMYTENKTWFLMGFGLFYLNEDRWRITAAGGRGDVNFQYYLDDPINRWLRYNTNADFAYVLIQRRVVPNVYGGLSYIYTTFKTNSDVYTDSTATELHGLGFDISIDKRSNISYPRSGYFINADLTTYPSLFGNQQESNQVTLAYNHYFSIRENKDVIATRAFTGIAVGNVNFNQQFIVGNTDIRGYSRGRYRGNYTIALQGEYRWNFYKRFGAVGFLGFATVFGANNSDDNGKILHGIGGGFRYTVMKETRSNVGFDIARGRGDWGFYFRLSEAF